MPFPIVRPLLQRDLEPLQKAAADDKSTPIYPTHLITRDGAIEGYFSIKPPYVNMWLNSKRIKARDSVHLLGVLDALVAQSGYVDYIVFFEEGTPFMPYMQKLGFTPICTAKCGFKKLFTNEPPTLHGG